MGGPITERRPAARPGPTSPEPLPDPVRQAVSAIAGAAGAWCPALSPDGGRLAYLVSPGGSICAELHGRRPPAVRIRRSW